ncbi:Calcium-regulated heat stable protein 1 [Dissostichus eleginoides]|uniref:Calcium-regulated heat stable protein 1 n=1 Tax=Dissostichus eleginoides TaxID=100907 RepID=A0AAD9EQ19_DISEL|nr:Calcium-regulated heat stable protein 1 [Dissostichus eleginoides]
MSSHTTPLQVPRPMTPPLPSPGSPCSPGSPESLHPPAYRQRDRSPSPMRGYLIPSPLPTRRNRTCSA